MSTDIKERISTMGYLFVLEGMAYPSITAIDSTLIKANGHVWHKSPMKKELYHILALIQMQDGGDTAIPKRDGFLDTNFILHRRQQQQQEIL
jgi:hypothetical protein